jgi:hypothetical protein
MAKPFQVEHARLIAAVMIVVGVVLSAISLPELLGLTTYLGQWSWWTLSIGLLLSVIGLYLLIVYLRNVTAFEKLMQLKSKAEFVRNQDDIEYLAWRLPSKFETRLSEKKRGFNIK